jgi:hypothetical protein
VVIAVLLLIVASLVMHGRDRAALAAAVRHLLAGPKFIRMYIIHLCLTAGLGQGRCDVMPLRWNSIVAHQISVCCFASARFQAMLVCRCLFVWV